MSDWIDQAVAEITPDLLPLVRPGAPGMADRLKETGMTFDQYKAYTEATAREWAEETRKRNAEIIRRHLAGRMGIWPTSTD
jgi:hypothetical protein